MLAQCHGRRVLADEVTPLADSVAKEGNDHVSQVMAEIEDQLSLSNVRLSQL